MCLSFQIALYCFFSQDLIRVRFRNVSVRLVTKPGARLHSSVMRLNDGQDGEVYRSSPHDHNRSEQALVWDHPFENNRSSGSKPGTFLSMIACNLIVLARHDCQI